MSRLDRQIAKSLLECGSLSWAQVQVALWDQLKTGVSFSEILLVRGWVTEQSLQDLILTFNTAPVLAMPPAQSY